MKILELSKELGVTNKELISFLKDHGYSVSSHMQTATDEMIELARSDMKPTKIETVSSEVQADIKSDTPTVNKSTKVFKPEDEIMCKSVTPWKLTAVGVDKNTVYHWEYFGDIDYVKYRDLQALRRTDYVMKPNIIIMDDDLRSQWSRELGDVYKYFDHVDYPEEYFDKSDNEFADILKNAPTWIVEIIKTTAVAMIRNENYPSLNKIKLIDDIVGTCIKDFL
jgi:hypothetical protein